MGAGVAQRTCWGYVNAGGAIKGLPVLPARRVVDEAENAFDTARVQPQATTERREVFIVTVIVLKALGVHSAEARTVKQATRQPGVNPTACYGMIAHAISPPWSLEYRLGVTPIFRLKARVARKDPTTSRNLKCDIQNLKFGDTLL
jgi:hypothetical protein